MFRPSLNTIGLSLALLLGLLVRLWWVFHLPFNDAPDEYCHWPMIRLLADEHRLPTMDDVPKKIPVSYPALPPLGYYPNALAVRAVPDNLNAPLAPLWAARLANLGLGLLTILAGYWALTQLQFSNAFLLAPAGAMVFALHPQLVFIQSYSNNDALGILLCTLLLGQWLHLASRQHHSRLYVYFLLGLTAGLAVLAKLNAAALVLAGLPLAGTLILQTKQPYIRVSAFLKFLLAGMVFLLTISPWILFSLSTHHSIWGHDIHQQWWFDFLAQHNIYQGRLDRGNLLLFLKDTFKTYWACFGYCTVLLPKVFYYLLAGLCTVGALGFLKLGHTLWTSASESSPSIARQQYLLLITGTLLTCFLHAWHSRTFGYSPQGRYLMPAQCALTAIMLSGICTLAGANKIRQALVSIFITVFFLVAQYFSILAQTHHQTIGQADSHASARWLTWVDNWPKPYPAIPPANQGWTINIPAPSPTQATLQIIARSHHAGPTLLHIYQGPPSPSNRPLGTLQIHPHGHALYTLALKLSSSRSQPRDSMIYIAPPPARPVTITSITLK